MRAAAVGLLLCLAAPAAAQTASDARPTRGIDIVVGGGWFGGVDLGTADASLRGSAASQTPLQLFATESRFAGAPVLEAAAGWSMSRRVVVEGALLVGHPELHSSVTEDVEGAPSVTVVERIDQYLVEGRVLVMLDELRVGPRTVPFVSAGIGYLRQRHEDGALVETGHAYSIGGGVKPWLRVSDAGIRAVGLRADVRLYLLKNGIAFDDGPQPRTAVSGTLFLTF